MLKLPAKIDHPLMTMTQVVRAKIYAGDVAEAMSIHYWQHDTDHHMQEAQKSLRELVLSMGYRIVKIDSPTEGDNREF